MMFALVQLALRKFVGEQILVMLSMASTAIIVFIERMRLLNIT